MKLETIIMVYKPDTKLNILVDRLLMQKVVPDKIKIMLTVSDECNAEILQKILPPVVDIREVDRSDFSHGGTRQLAADGSDADYIMFMTQDAIPANSYLTKNLLDGISKKKAAVAYARQIPYEDSNEVEKFSRRFNYPPKSCSKTMADLKKMGIKTIFCSDACAIYNRKIFDKLGGFECDTDFNEDMLYACKAITNGYSVEYVAGAQIKHSHNLSFTAQYERNKAIAISQKKHPEVFEKISSESEGFRYFFAGVRYFISHGKPAEVFKLFVSCAVRYSGFFVGKHFCD